MSIYDQDTDPSSPEARAARQSTPEPAVTASPRSATTDPGVGPPSAPGAARATGVVVPGGTPRPAAVVARGMPVSAPTRGGAAPKDSVELLLEGMGGPRPDRTKTTPQTGGEAAAAYHAEHSLRAGHAGHDEDVKVLVDTVRLPPAAETDEMGLRFAAEPTFILPSRQGPRIVVAALAGLLVVVAIFAYLDREARQAAAVAAPQAPLPGEPLTRAAVASPEVPRPAEIPMPVAPAAAEPARAAPQPVAEAPAAPAVVEAPPPAAAPAAVASRTRATGHVQKSPGDMGEFKSSF